MSAGSLPRVGRASPVTLLTWAGRVGVGRAFEAEWPALGVSVALVIAALALAWFHFRQQEF